MAIRRGLKWALLMLALSACAPVHAQTPAARQRISVDALVADAQGYVSGRYHSSELPAALITDLTAEGFSCQHSATASQCVLTQEANAACFDVYEVQITAQAVTAEKDRRCMGAEE